MYEKILVPLDGSKLAEVVLPYAEELAGRLGSAITLTHVAEKAEDEYQHMHQSYMKNMVDTTKRNAEKYLQKPAEKAVKIQPVILTGDPAEEIVDYAEKEDVGLILMSTHGRSGISRWAMGSVANKVLRAANRPVVLIKAENYNPDVRRERGVLDVALVSLDGSKESEAVLPYIEELASRLQAEIFLLYVFEPVYLTETATLVQQLEADRKSSLDYVNRITAQLKQKGLSVKSEMKEKRQLTVAEEIIKTSDEINADLIAMSTHGRSGVGRWAFGSVADRILHTSNVPILLVKTPGANK